MLQKKNLKRNEIVAAPQGHKINFKKEIPIKKFHLIDLNKELFKKEVIKSPKKVFSRIRQVGELLPSILTYNRKKKQYKITLKKAITGVSEGQAIVLYQKTKTLGGGVISF